MINHFTKFKARAGLRLAFLLALFLSHSGLQAQTYTFTTCGNTGRFGPTQTQANTAYTSTNLSGQVTVNNGIQQWVVPQSGWYTIITNGAQGGTVGSYPGGLGASMQGDFFLAQGDTINVLVGQRGENVSYNTGGGGGSFVWISGQTTEPLIAAGGGGGSGLSAAGVGADTAASGKLGTSSLGTPGTGGNGANPGGGGWKSVGNDFTGSATCAVKCTGNAAGVTVGGATPFTTIVFHGCAGTSQTGDGGFGGGSGGNGNCTSSYGAGGGGGYSGGVGQSGSSAGGGGGGSYNSGTNQLNLPASNSGDGTVVFNFIGGSNPNNAGITALPSLATTACAGPLNVTAKVVNFGNNVLDSVYVDWSVNGVLQTGQWFVFNPALDTAGSPNNFAVVNLGSFNLVANTPTTVTAWTAMPNGVVDTFNANDTSFVSLQAAMSGSYTINSALPAGAGNYTTFGSLISDLTSFGVCGPITVDVTGTYTEQVDIGVITGVSAVNTVTFNGNNTTTLTNTLTASSTNYATLNLDGADYFTFKNMNISALGTSYGFAVHLMNNADHNTFDSCAFSVNPTATSTAMGCVSMSAARNSYSSSGSNGSYNTFSNCTLNGGYFAFMFYGSSTSGNMGNTITNCHATDYYIYGAYGIQQGSMTVSHSIFERPTRTTVSTFYGVILTTGCTGGLVEGNIVRNSCPATPSSSFTAYPLYCSAQTTVGNENRFINNIVGNIQGIGIRGGLYLTGATNIQAYHNTIVLDHTATSASTLYGIYSSGTTGVDIRNNNVVITQPSNGTKYGLYYSGTGKTSDNNNVYVNAGGTGVSNFGYYSAVSPTTYTSLAAWQAMTGTPFDQNSVDMDPLFVNPANGDFTPTNSLMDNLGAALGVTVDILGNSRSSTTPDIGAVEFSVPLCSGTPTAGTVTGPPGACPGQSFTMNLSGFSIGNGITIQWEYSPAGAGFWQQLPNATSPSYTESAGITTATDYRVVVTCANGGSFDISNVLTMNINPFYACYCVPTYASGGTSDNITNVQLGLLNNNTTAAGNPSPYYQDYTSQQPSTIPIPDLLQGVSYNVSVTFGGDASQYSMVWFDWNQDGIFDTTEAYTAGTNAGANGTTVITVNVPLTAVVGPTRMRVRGGDDVQPSNTQACGATNSSFGEAEDYLVNVLLTTACAGTPVAGTAFGPDSVCANVPFTITDTSATLAAGITYQWEWSPYGAGTWLPISGATTTQYTESAGITAATDYRLVVTCTNSSSVDITNVHSVSGLYPASQCYCIPVGASATYGIDGFTTTGAISNISNTSSGLSPNGYGNFTSMVLSANPTTTVNFTTNFMGSGLTYGFAIFVDWGQDGSFAEPGDMVYTTTGYNSSPLSGSFTVPTGAISGTTRMRIHSNYLNGNPSGEYCSAVNYTYAEWEDYTFDVVPLTPCSGAPVAGTASASIDTVCVSGDVTLTLAGYTITNTGIDINWQSSPTGLNNFVDIPGASTSVYTVLGVNTATDFRARVTCNSPGGSTVYSNVLGVAIVNPSVAQTFPGSRCGTGPVTLAALAANGGTIKWYDALTGGNLVGTGNAFTTPSIGVTTDYFAAASQGGGGAPTAVPLPASGSDYTGGTVRGYYFTAPCDFTITGVRAVTVATTGAQSIGIVKFTGNTAPPAYSATTTAYTTLFFTQNDPITGVIPVNIPVHTGEVIGVLGQRGNAVGYAATSGAFASTINGNPVTLTRMLQQSNLSTTPLGAISAEATGQVGLVELTYAVGCEGTRVPVTATINPAASGTGLATGGTTVGNAQGTGTTVSYTDACNDTVAVVNSGTTNMGATSAIVLTSSTVQTFGGKPFVPRAYDITPATSGPATVTLYALQSEFNAYNSYVNAGSLGLPLLPTGPTDVAGMANIVITQYHGLASAGTQGPLGLYSNTNVDYIPNSSITVTPIGNYWKLTFPVTGFSGFFIHTGATPLSIKLESISATNAGSRNRIDWKTGNEMSGDRFELERSIDGQFIKIADIAAKGQPSGYSYWDETPVTGMNYYRLKMIEASGRYSYSQTVQAMVKSGSFTVSAYPNPVREQLTVKVYGTLDKDASVTITDVTGKVVRRVTMDQAQVQISMNGLAQGMYLIKYTDASHSQTIKMTKE